MGIERDLSHNKQARDSKNPDMNFGVYRGHQGEWTNQGNKKGDLKKFSDCSNQVYIDTKRLQRHTGFSMKKVWRLEAPAPERGPLNTWCFLFIHKGQRIHFCPVKKQWGWAVVFIIFFFVIYLATLKMFYSFIHYSFIHSFIWKPSKLTWLQCLESLYKQITGKWELNQTWSFIIQKPLTTK